MDLNMNEVKKILLDEEKKVKKLGEMEEGSDFITDFYFYRVCMKEYNVEKYYNREWYYSTKTEDIFIRALAGGKMELDVDLFNQLVSMLIFDYDSEFIDCLIARNSYTSQNNLNLLSLKAGITDRVLIDIVKRVDNVEHLKQLYNINSIELKLCILNSEMFAADNSVEKYYSDFMSNYSNFIMMLKEEFVPDVLKEEYFKLRELEYVKSSLEKVRAQLEVFANAKDSTLYKNTQDKYMKLKLEYEKLENGQID